MLAIGSTRFDKGLDILLNALNYVAADFKLIIAGKESYFRKEQIESLSKKYSDNVFFHLDVLTDVELIGLYKLCDLVVLPYRKIFDGASGPLVEGVFFNKVIVGPNHGSLGDIIYRNKLGYTFESESSEDLAKVLNLALNDKFEFEEEYYSYKKKLTQKGFAAQYEALYRRMA